MSASSTQVHSSGIRGLIMKFPHFLTHGYNVSCSVILCLNMAHSNVSTAHEAIGHESTNAPKHNRVGEEEPKHTILQTL